MQEHSFLSSEEMVECYEELRRNGRDNHKTSRQMGLALFIRRGMAAWMKAFSDHTPAREKLDKRTFHGKPGVPAEFQDHIVMLLAGMVLQAAGKEGEI
jgi:hypothetical protein